MSDLSSLSLDELFSEARAALRIPKASVAQGVPKKDKPPVAAPDAPPAYLDLSTWKAQRAVTLVLTETRTVLGTFTEYRHPHLPDARRLVREVSELPSTAVEYVSGIWEQPVTPPVATPRLWNTHRELTLDLVLAPLRVAAPKVAVSAKFGEGRLVRVELEELTTFSPAPSAKGDPSFLQLPGGVDIYPMLSYHCIRAILTSLDQPLPHDFDTFPSAAGKTSNPTA